MLTHLYKSVFGRVVLAATLLAGMALPASAEQFSTFYQGARPLGMGGAFTAVADDHNALFYNPAGLTQNTKWNSLDLINIEAEASAVAFDVYGDVTKTQTQAEAALLIRNNIGEHFRVRADTLPNVIMPNFGMGVIGQVTLDGEFRNRVSPNIRIVGKADVGLTASVARKMVGGRLSLGGSARYVRRKGVDKVYTVIEVAGGNVDPYADMGAWESDVSFDLGAMVRPPLPFSPVFAITALNITDLDFGLAGEVPMQVNLGVAVRPKIGAFTVNLAADYVDLTNNLVNDTDRPKRINLGAEVQLWKFMAVRAGLHQGYLTAGATLDVWVLKLDVATYAEELGAYAGQRDDRRYIARLDLF